MTVRTIYLLAAFVALGAGPFSAAAARPVLTLPPPEPAAEKAGTAKPPPTGVADRPVLTLPPPVATADKAGSATPPPAVSTYKLAAPQPAAAAATDKPAAPKPAAAAVTDKPVAPQPAANNALADKPAAPKPAAAASTDKPPAPKPAPAATAAPPLDVPSVDATKVINWVIATRDSGNEPFIVIDKVAAEMWVFDPTTKMRRRAPILIGSAKGDDTAPGLADLELSQIPASQRTTPAGRFPSRTGPAYGYKEVLWIDLTSNVALHPVVTNTKEKRVQRLESATPTDNRITFGCINVDADFYNKFVSPLFGPAGGIVYIVPEKRALHEVFAGLPADVAAPARPSAAPPKAAPEKTSRAGA